MQSPKISSQLLELAARLLGSEEELRRQLRCSEDDFLAYKSGAKDLPWPEHDRLIALVVREQARLIEKSKQLLDELSKRRPPEA